MKGIAKAAAVAVAVAAGLALAGCSGGSSSSSSSSSGPVSLVFWNNGTGDKSQAYWQSTIADFEAQYPGVTVTAQVVQDADFDAKLQSAMQANTTPDIFLQRGGQKLADQVAAGQVLDITNQITSDTKSALGDAAFSFDELNGKIYAMPMSVQPEGFWYNQDLFDKAGITSTPTDMASFNAAVTSLKNAGITPIALGGATAWPAAHYFYSFALRECSQQVIQNLPNDKALDDPCWLKAIQDVSDLNATNPFEQGFLTVQAQTGAGSSAGLIATGQAAMELQGAWEPGTVGQFTPDGQNLSSLRFFPFPAVPGGQGDPSAVMAGSDGYSCSAKAPEPACVNFLNFIAQTKYQEGYATAYSTLPTNKNAMSVVTDPALLSALQTFQNAKYNALWFDSALGSDTGTAVNNAIVALLAGQQTPQQALQAMQTAVKGS